MSDFIARIVLALAAFCEAHNIRVYRVGGLYHWRIGRLGGSVYFKKAPRKARVSKLLLAIDHIREISRKPVAPVVIEPVTAPSKNRIDFAMSTIRH